MKSIKLVCTIGPACTEKIPKMVDLGMNVARFNLSHNTFDWHEKYIKKIKKYNQVATLLDTRGAEVRTQELDPLEIKKHEIITLSTKNSNLKNKIIKQTHPSLPKYVKKGTIILIDDGNIELEVISKTKTEIKCKAKNNAILKSRKSISIPNTDLNLPSITKYDIESIKFANKLNLDFIALSMIQHSNDIKKVKKLTQIPLIAKIEHPKALDDIDNIIDNADAIMIARGDLGLNIPPEQVPIIQKELIVKCAEKNKPVIVATQMLESMTTHPYPTRAETSDVANAILDGADAVMLSGETASGDYPLHSIKMMNKIIENTEPYVPDIKIPSDTIPEVIAESAKHAVITLDIKAIICTTHSGFTASLISKFNPKIPILTLTKNHATMKKLALVKGVYQFPITYSEKQIIKWAKDNKLLKKEDLIAVLCKESVSKHKKTVNTLKIKHVDLF